MDAQEFRRRLDKQLWQRCEEIETRKLEVEQLDPQQRKQLEGAADLSEQLHREMIGPNIRHLAEGLARALKSRHEPTLVSLPPKGWQCTVNSKGAAFRITVLAQAEVGRLCIVVRGEFCKSALFTRGRATLLFEHPLRVDLDEQELETKLQNRLIECAISCVEIAKK